ncbi:MAG: putative 4-hydroxybenzoate polyprenyltransferase, partial [Bacteroidales bacterium]|jgi:4-hydroxybenzoate polyprenyltransferase|nr:putative 4-hydroxybenzoate polyprenyltransferase [Bacteroidales bacterium]
MLKYFSLIKFSHTIFAMPFAAIGFCLAVFGSGEALFSWLTLVLVLLCMVFARTAAMAFNRYIDYEFDAKNARTAVREIPSGKISPRAALVFCIINALCFMVAAYFLNFLCFVLSPVALAVIMGYSYTKRFTAWCHIILGLGLSLSPIGAYIAVTGEFAVLPIIFSVIVLTWSGGFDILYALQDEDFDKSQALHSIPVRFGRAKSLGISIAIHCITVVLVLLAGFVGNFSVLYWVGATLFVACLVFQHAIVSPQNISRVNMAFATANGCASIVFGIFTIADLALL